jgi:hypothetical protein
MESPLHHPDPPIALDLGAAIHDAYRRARYDLEIDYREPRPRRRNSPPPTPRGSTHTCARGLRD